MIQPAGTTRTPIRSGRIFDREQTDAARESLTQTIDFLMERATPRDERAVGDYLVGYAVQPAEGIYHLSGGELVWQSAKDENVHVVISVRDALDGRFLPSVAVRLTLLDASGQEIGTREQPFVWHPWLYDYGYGCNWNVPKDGKYTLRVCIEPKPDDYTPATIEFKNVRITPSAKAR